MGRNYAVRFRDSAGMPHSAVLTCDDQADAERVAAEYTEAFGGYSSKVKIESVHKIP